MWLWSTYGDRSHGQRPDYVKELEIIQATFDRGGNVVIPSLRWAAPGASVFSPSDQGGEPD